jgi:hypothetical protein
VTATANGALSGYLRRLEQRVSQLEAQAAGGEQLTPNYLTISPSGQVGAIFSGHVKAQGLDLTEQIVSGFANLIQWLDAGGTQRERITGVISGVLHQLIMLSAADVNDQAGITAQTQAGGGAGTALVQVSAMDFINGLSFRRLLDSAGQSDYLQLAGGAQLLQLAIVTGAANWAGATPDSGLVTIAHGLGRTPQIALPGNIGNNSNGVGFHVFTSGAGWDGTNVYCVARAENDLNQPGGTTGTVAVAVIG